MNISLTPALEKYVQDKVTTGLYNSVSEVIREAVRLLINQEKCSNWRLQALYNDIDECLKDTVSYEGHSTMKKLIDRYE